MSLEHSPARDGRHTKLAMTINEFCASHSIARSMFYKLKRQGLAPRIMAVGIKQLITAESAAEWRAIREAATNPTISENSPA
jgi:hypothetical protein